MEIPILLGATTGARRSEVCGLLWSDIDLKTGRLTIRRGLQWVPTADDSGRMRKELVFTELKTPRARRTMRLLPQVVERLREHRKDQMERHLKLGRKWNATHGDIVCDRGDGRPTTRITSPRRSSESQPKLASIRGRISRTCATGSPRRWRARVSTLTRSRRFSGTHQRPSRWMCIRMRGTRVRSKLPLHWTRRSTCKTCDHVLGPSFGAALLRAAIRVHLEDQSKHICGAGLGGGQPCPRSR